MEKGQQMEFGMYVSVVDYMLCLPLCILDLVMSLYFICLYVLVLASVTLCDLTCVEVLSGVAIPQLWTLP